MIRTDSPVFLGASDVAAIVGIVRDIRANSEDGDDLALLAACRECDRILRIIEHAQTGDYKAGERG